MRDRFPAFGRRKNIELFPGHIQWGQVSCMMCCRGKEGDVYIQTPEAYSLTEGPLHCWANASH